MTELSNMVKYDLKKITVDQKFWSLILDVDFDFFCYILLLAQKIWTVCTTLSWQTMNARLQDNEFMLTKWKKNTIYQILCFSISWIDLVLRINELHASK